MNFKHQLLFNLYDKRYQSFNECKNWYDHYNRMLDAVFHNHGYYFRLNDKMLNLNNDSYKFVDVLYNTIYNDEIYTIFHNIIK